MKLFLFHRDGAADAIVHSGSTCGGTDHRDRWERSSAVDRIAHILRDALSVDRRPVLVVSNKAKLPSKKPCKYQGCKMF